MYKQITNAIHFLSQMFCLAFLLIAEPFKMCLTDCNGLILGPILAKLCNRNNYLRKEKKNIKVRPSYLSNSLEALVLFCFFMSNVC